MDGSRRLFRFGNCVDSQQECVKHFARDGRRRRSTEAAVLDQDGDGYLRIIGRRIGDEPRVIASSFFHDFRAGIFGLFDGEHLSGAGFAGKVTAIWQIPTGVK